jgi:hypothetical protein
MLMRVKRNILHAAAPPLEPCSCCFLLLAYLVMPGGVALS